MHGWRSLRQRQPRKRRGARHNIPNQLSPWASKPGRKSIGCLGPQASFVMNCSILKSGFQATTRQRSQTICSAGSLISHSSDGNRNPLVVCLPSDHPLAKHKAIDPHDLVGETFIGISEIPRVLRAVINAYLKRTGIELTPHLEIDNFAMAISLVASTRGVALLPASAENFLTWSVVVRPLKGETPTIDLVVGFHKANTSPILRTFLSRLDDLTTRISSKTRSNH
jgi:LysR substrate binding domain